ncbi:MAG: phage tail protein [Pasteurellales bacterium]|nr:MAG: phage tail protein [Pasteurellales bacterium]
MSQNLKLQVMLEAMDKLSAPFKNAQKQISKTSKLLNENKQAFRNFEKQQKQIDSIKKMTKGLESQSKSIEKVTAKINKYSKEVSELKERQKSVKKGIKDSAKWAKEALRNDDSFDYADAINAQREYEHELESISEAIQRNNYLKAQSRKVLKEERTERVRQYLQLRSLRKQLKESGIDTKKLFKSEKTLAENMAKATKEIEKQKKALEKLEQAQARQRRYRARVENMKQTSERFQILGQRSMVSGAAILAPTIAIGKGVTSMTQTAAQFEQFKAILETTEGSSTKAQKSLDWVREFATKTPYELKEVTAAFVRLRAYGMNPTNGLLKTLGDTSSAMGEPLMQAVEAIADAVTGENERLKAFGIKASAIKGTNIIEYVYTDKMGKQRVAKANKNNRKQIEETITKIWSLKYDDSMNKQSETIIGIWSNLQDKWSDFQIMIMQSGAFDWIKEKLKGVLDNLNKMTQNGELQKWAEDVGAVIKEIAQGLFEFGQKVFEAVKFVAKFARENKGLITTFVKWSAISGSLLTTIGGLSMVLSFAIYPIARLGLGISKYTGILRLAEKANESFTLSNIKAKKHLFTFQGTKNYATKAKSGLLSFSETLKNKVLNGLIILWSALPKTGSYVMKFLGNFKKVDFWLKALRMACFSVVIPFKALLLGLSLALSPIGIAIAAVGTALVGVGMIIYKNWQPIKAFFIGFWQGLISALSPVLEKFKPLGELLGLIGDKIKACWDWFTKLISPVSDATGKFEGATSAGQRFGEIVGGAIGLIMTPLNIVLDGIKMIKDSLSDLSIDGITKSGKDFLNSTADTVTGFWNKMWGDNEPPKIVQKVQKIKQSSGADEVLNTFSSGGFVGSGGKYEPKGIVHGGEYVMTKEATQRLGIANLNRLNYGKVGAMATLAGSVAMAQPQVKMVKPLNVKVDNRPLISASKPQSKPVAPVNQNITITVNASPGQDAQQIARIVAMELEKRSRQEQAKARGYLFDR